jgi:hypothetical protein
MDGSAKHRQHSVSTRHFLIAADLSTSSSVTH